MLPSDGIRSPTVAPTPVRAPAPPPPSPPVAPSGPVYGPPAPPPPDRDVGAAADRVMDAGARTLWKDDYDKRAEVLAQEMAQGNLAFRAQLMAEVIERDDGAFDSWLTAGRLNDRLESGHILQSERDAVVDGMQWAVAGGLVAPDKVPADFVRDTHDGSLIATYMRAQDLNDRGGFERALQAFSGVNATEMDSFANSPSNALLMRDFTLSVQQHQDWYENQTVDLMVTGGGGMFGAGMPVTHDAPVSFSKEQLAGMRTAFKDRDGLMTNGELLLAYPDRLERNEQVTRQYYELSNGMAGIVGQDNANWATFAVSASDEIGRNLDGTAGIALAETAFSDPRYWLSVGNSKLISDIGPGFRHFVDTFGDGRNRDMSFDDFWKGFESKWGGRGISYLDGNNDPQNDMKNAFKAYYDAMKLQDQEKALSATNPASADQRAELAEQRAQLMLYGNTLVGLQEQDIVQPEIENGLKVLGMTNPGGLGAWGIDFHLPDANTSSPRRLDTDVDLPNTPYRVDAGGSFTTVDGQTIQLDQALKDRLNGLDGDLTNEDESNPANSGTDHWESYPQRMGYIYQLFADYQRDGQMFNDPRALFGSRAQALNNEPLQIIP
jgi:hypothetical protein